MVTQLTKRQAMMPLTGFALSAVHYEVRDLMRLFYKASHKKKAQCESSWLITLETHLACLKVQRSSYKDHCNTVQQTWYRVLHNVVQAVTQFEASYQANCPCAGLLPSPFINRVRNIRKDAQLVLLYMEVSW